MIATGTVYMTNTVVYGATDETMLYTAPNQTFSATYSLVKGMTLSGTGNLAGTTNPKLRFDGRLLHDSPLAGAGGSISTSRLDMDLDLRPANNRGIGVDEWADSDTDGLPDGWEVFETGGLTALGGNDTDADALTDLEEYEYSGGSADGTVDPTDPDTDGDNVPDGVEIDLGTDPLVFDSDTLDVDSNGDGILDSIGAQLGLSFFDTDLDDDGLTNVQEVTRGTDTLRSDSDGDGVSDGQDPFPFDASLSALSPNPGDTTPPVITLTAPAGAVLQ